MSIESLVNEFTTAKSFDIVKVRKRIHEEFNAATTSDQRGNVLAIFDATMDQVERDLAARGDQGELFEKLRTHAFRTTRADALSAAKARVYSRANLDDSDTEAVA